MAIRIKLRNDMEQHYAAILSALPNKISSRASLQQRMLAADALLTQEYVKKHHNPCAQVAKLEAILPIVAAQVGTASAYLAKTFLSNDTIFPIVSVPEGDEVASQFNALMSKQADEFQWRRNLLLALVSGMRYPVMGVEATWKVNVVNKPLNRVDPKTATLARGQVARAGFSIRNLDMYNTFWDTSVPPARVSEDGDFAGYVELMTTTLLLRKLQGMGALEGIPQSKVKAIVEAKGIHNYYTPAIRVDTSVEQRGYAEIRFEQIFGKDPAQAKMGNTATTLHEVTTIYMRMLPYVLGLTAKDIKGINPNTIQVFKFVLVGNSVIAHVELRDNMHENLPIFLGQPSEDGLGYQTGSMAEDLASLQNLASSLITGDLQSTRRALADRLIYDASLVREEDINSAEVTKKIPVRNSAYNKGLDAAVKHIPFEDRMAGTRISMAEKLYSFSQLLTGQNTVNQGQFVKGNKTDSQFELVMSNASSRQLLMAFLLEDQFFTPIKETLMSDLLQYQEPIEVLDRKTRQLVKIDPSALRDANYRFEITDGLVDVAKHMSTDVMMTAFQTIAANPQLAAGYNVPQLFSHLMSLLGVRDLDAFIVPAQPQQGNPQDGNQPPPVASSVA